jgi:hypothetical protein
VGKTAALRFAAGFIKDLLQARAESGSKIKSNLFIRYPKYEYIELFFIWNGFYLLLLDRLRSCLASFTLKWRCRSRPECTSSTLARRLYSLGYGFSVCFSVNSSD